MLTYLFYYEDLEQGEDSIHLFYKPDHTMGLHRRTA